MPCTLDVQEHRYNVLALVAKREAGERPFLEYLSRTRHRRAVH